MNDNDIELRLEKLLGGAPVVPAPEGLRRAVSAQGAAEPTSGGDLPSPAPRPVALRRGRRARTVSALAGLAATFVLAAGLLVILSNRPAPGAGGPIERIDWQTAQAPEDLGSAIDVFYVLDGRLYFAGNGLWSYDERGREWTRLAGGESFGCVTALEGVLEGAPSDCGPIMGAVRGFASDGRGGLIAYGLDGYQSGVAMIWRSHDGRAWSSEPLGKSGGSLSLSGVSSYAAADGLEIAALSNNCGSGLNASVWVGKGGAWRQIELPGGSGYSPRDVVRWRDLWVVNGPLACDATPPKAAVKMWTSTNGYDWTVASGEVPLDGTLLGLDDKLVVYDGWFSGRVQASSDLATWREVTFGGHTPAVDRVVQVHGALLADDRGWSLWTSTDGLDWTAVPAGAARSTSLQAAGDDMVVAFSQFPGVGRRDFLIGKITRGG